MKSCICNPIQVTTCTIKLAPHMLAKPTHAKSENILGFRLASCLAESRASLDPPFSNSVAVSNDARQAQPAQPTIKPPSRDWLKRFKPRNSVPVRSILLPFPVRINSTIQNFES